jgi:hypothetical protein
MFGFESWIVDEVAWSDICIETFCGQGFKMITLLEDCVSGHGLTFVLKRILVA